MSWFGIIQGYCQIEAKFEAVGRELAEIGQYPQIIPNHHIRGNNQGDVNCFTL